MNHPWKRLQAWGLAVALASCAHPNARIEPWKPADEGFRGCEGS